MKTRINRFRDYVILFIIACLTMVLPFCIDGYLPSFRSIEQYFAAPLNLVQMSIAIFTLFASLSMLFSGVISDILGRKSMILIALTLFFIFSIAIIFTHSIYWFLFFRAMQGLCAGVLTVLSRSIVKDLYSGVAAHKAMALISILFAICPIFAPMVGGYLDYFFSWKAVFIFIAVIALLLFIAYGLVVPESLPQENRNIFNLVEIFGKYTRLLKNKEFMSRGVALAILSAPVPILIGTMTYLMIDVLNYQNTDFALLFAPSVLGGVTGSIFSAKLSTRWSEKQYINMSLSISVITLVVSCILLYIFKLNLMLAAIPWFLFIFAYSFFMPTANIYIMDLLDKKNQGLASTFISFFQMMSFSIYIGLIAPLLHGNVVLIYFMTGIFMILGFTFWKLLDWNNAKFKKIT